MQVHYDEGVANRIDPESCAYTREGSRQLDRFWKPFPQRPNERNCVRARVRNPCVFRLRQRIDVSDDNAEYSQTRSG